ncbi:MAG: type II toxin-antitoxin system VapC family toxin [Rhodospirillales bacterium]|nr:MAG: type II toxin-antitoxin system VapC family toxin [Rhodospirillales bacterium]
MFFLDTNIVIGIITARAMHLVDRLKSELKRGTPLAIPVPVLFELRYGAAKSSHPARNHCRLDDFLLATPDIIPFDADDAAEAGDIRAALESAGRPIGPYDVLIAAQARRRGAALVTANGREFQRIPGLIVTDWTA